MGYEINPAHSVSARERILDESFFFDLFFIVLGASGSREARNHWIHARLTKTPSRKI